MATDGVMGVDVVQVDADQAAAVFALVARLLHELGEEGGAVKSLGRARGWRRVDVTAPESARWRRTRQFYESMGFKFTGPKLKLALS